MWINESEENFMGTHTTSPNLHTEKKQAMGGAPPTWIGAPVLRTFWPRTRPSVVSIAIVLTVLSPKCCATSSTTLRGLSCTSRAVRIGGRPLSNFTSTTAPITVAICPILPAPVKSAEVLSVANPCTIPAGPRLLLPPLRKDPLRSPLEVALITALEDDDDPPPPRRLLPTYPLLPNDLDCCSVCCLAAALLAPAALPVRKTAVKALLPDMAYSLSLLPLPLSLRVIPDHAHDPELVIVARKHRSGCTLVNAVTTRDAADSRSVCAQRRVP